MRILYYDCFSGISGDMNLGAMIDVGVDKEYLISQLSKLNLHEFEVKIKKDMRKGISGTKVDVLLNHHEEHAHNHCHGEHEQHHHHHRNLHDIEEIINKSDLNENVKEISLAMFKKVAEAEGKIHGKDIYEVHFHEVGAVDSIVDIVGAAICIDYLKVDKVICSTIELGSGFVNCAHGTMPVPAPATMEILKGIKTRKGKVPFEATTPTGAAIASELAEKFTDDISFNIHKVGYGIGNKDEGDIPNVLRVFVGETGEVITEENNCMIECNIDDMNPEIYEYVIEKLFDVGVSDAYLVPIIMKKGRPAVKLSVLCKEEIEDKVKKVIFEETTTIGYRKYGVCKEVLKRECIEINTIYGKVKVKNSSFGEDKIKYKPEYEDCKRLAKENNVPILEIYNSVYASMNN